MISIAMTTYNGEKYLSDQLESLLNQTMLPDEIIICDDCSTDKTMSILKEYKSKHPSIIRLYANKHNVGYKNNFMRAIGLTTGDVIFLCDQDDIWNSAKISEMVGVLKQDGKICVLNTAMDFIDSEGKPLHPSYESKSSNMSIFNSLGNKNEIINVEYRKIRQGNISPGCTICFTKDTKEIFLSSYDTSWPHDLCINYIGALRNGLYFYSKSLTHYRIHRNNTIGLSFASRREHRSFKEKLKIVYANAQHDYMVAQSLSAFEHNEKYTNMIIQRYTVLSNRSLFQIVKLFNNNAYKECTSIKERIIDMIICIVGAKNEC